MVSLQEFVGRITRVNGVRSYLIVRRDGQILSQNIRTADRVSAMVVMCGLSAESLMAAAGLSRFRCLVLARGTREKLLLWPAKHFFLLVIEGPGIYTPDLQREVEEVLQTTLPS
jgi:predicted regulator of Ras-like GTPase activity (Roadblock/LC7/MglB family)